MNREFGFYEYAGIIVPGSVLIMGAFWLWPDATAIAEARGVSLGELGIFVLLAYALGQLLQGVGNGVEALWWMANGGMPSRQVLSGRWLSAEQNLRLRKDLQSDGLVLTDATSLTDAEALAIVREVYATVSNAGRSARVDSFNGTYGLLRGLAAALSILLAASLILSKGTLAFGILAVLFVLAVQRMHRFGRYYALELFIQYLLISRDRRVENGS